MGLTVRRGEQTILNGCTATFPGGRRSVLWGNSGAGKSTLLGAIAGLIPPQDGRISLGSEVWLAAADGVRVAPHRRRIGFVFQDLALWPHLTALQQVHLVGRTAGVDAAGALALLESVGLDRLATSRPAELSGGEQQRLAIARALAGKPTVLLLDEPFASVDREARSSLYALIRGISPMVRGPTIYVTHNVDDAESLAECAFRLRDGALALEDRPWEHPST